MAGSIGTIKVRVGADIRGLERGLKNAQYSLLKFSRQTGNIANSINRNLVLPFGIAGAAGVKLASDLESNFAKIENLVGVTGDTLDGFKDGVKDLSSEVGKSQAELSNALFTVTSAGLRGAEAMEVLESASKASAIGLGDTNEVARALTGVMQSYGAENYNAAKATDVLTAIVREGNLEAESLAPVLGRVTGLAATMGISFEEVGASIATFTRLGVSAEEAVTALRGTMTNFLNPADQAVKEMESLGLSVTEVQDAIRKDGLAKTLVDLIKRYEGNEEALGNLIPNVRALAGVLGTAGRQGEAYTDILDNIAQSTGIVDDGFESVSETSAKKFDKALVSLQNAGIELGATLLPLAVDLASTIKELADRFAGLDAQTKANIVRFGAMAAAVGGSLKVISMFSGAISSAAGTMTIFVGAVRKAMLSVKTFDKVLGATKIGLLIGGIWLAYEAYQALTGTLDNTTKHQKKLNTESDKLAQSHKDQAKEVNDLFEVLKSGESTQEERINAYNRLNDISPDVVKNIDAETRSLKKLQEAQEGVNKAMSAKQYQEINESIQDTEITIGELRDRLKEVRSGAQPTREELRRFSDEVYNTEGVISSLGANIVSALSPNERMKAGVTGITLLIADLEDQINDFKKQQSGIDLTSGLNLPRGGNRLANLKKENDDVDKEEKERIANEKARQAEREKLQKERAKAVRELYSTLDKELRKANEMFQVHGNVQQQAEQKTDAYLSAIEGLIDKGFSAGSKAVQDLIMKMNMVQAEFDSFKADRIVSEVEKVNTLKVAIPVDLKLPELTRDNLPELDTTIAVEFDQEPLTAFGQTVQDLFNQINENGGQIGEDFGRNFIKGVDAAVVGLQALDGFQTALNEKRRAELEEDYQLEKERIEQTVGNEESKAAALEKLDKKYQAKSQEIQKKAANQQKIASISESIINTAVAATRALRVDPTGILSGIVAALGAAQTAVIASTPTGYAKGGKVKLQEGKVSGITNTTPRADGDHILAYLKAGEAVLNAQQIRAIGPEVLAAARVPGFNTGGAVGKVPQMAMSQLYNKTAQTIHVTFSEPRWDGEELVLGIDRVKQNLESHSAI